MAIKNYSRLARTEKRNAFRSTIVYVILTIALLALLFVFGVTLLSGSTNFLSIFNENNEVFSRLDNTPPPPPLINELPEYTTKTSLKISGTSEEGATITFIFNSEKNEVLTDINGKFSSSFKLSEGENTLFAFSTDKNGNKSTESKQHRIIFDNTPPNLEIIVPEDNASYTGESQKQLTIEGTTEPNTQVVINEKIVIVDSTGKFKHLTSLSEGENIFTIVSRDKAGNESEITRRVTLKP